MTLQQTVTIPADRRLHLDLPETFSSGDSPLSQAEFEAGVPCPLDHTPNAETIAALQEVQDMIDGKISHTVYHSLEDMLEDLHN
jgi:hypothetical protein